MGDRKQARDARDEGFQCFLVGRWPRLMRTAFLLTGEQHAAEDLVQTTLEQVYVAWRRVGSTDDPDTYVRRVMINAHARRHRRRLKEFPAPRSDTDLVPELPDGDDRMAQADDRGALLTALSQLPPRQREAVVLRYWEDLSESQTAEAMGCSVGTVKSNASKGLAKLRAIPGLIEMATQGSRM
ncbi:SigE family RNA polymerase sigma factor [Streptomyces caniscabiei]|uniref:SigE family RNA polymerase sigma factor n=1 Tax=Streptomyces caniscabiei TaxID=2746961 RepID=UPI0029A89CD4|nr:SigE family RNA polymerase sigma factor [Streptomyces caniscabiei]MDX2598988.1 SigE family RNA polymerase sigma factor [Streptomyces caniscabiei]MDX2736458.1 SigE family RNA polymerase sigma factor [Streptomyces caniscabiei]MDX2782940.1 SigE family RNA polymerase sigma factor [Streptomyces caniscabiei]